MGRAPCCDKAKVKKGPWSPEEDAKLKDFIDKNGTGGNWIALPQKAGLKRCGKSCRLRWLNYLRPNIKHGEFTDDEDRIICSLYATIGSRWSIIAGQLPGRTDNDIKNYWNTKLKKKLMSMMLLPPPPPPPPPPPSPPSSKHMMMRASSSSSSTLPATLLLHQNPFPFSGLDQTLSLHHYYDCFMYDVMNNNNNNNNHQGLLNPMTMGQQYNHHHHQVFGGDQGSGGSSSDGSCGQISYDTPKVDPLKQHSDNTNNKHLMTMLHHPGFQGTGGGDNQIVMSSSSSAAPGPYPMNVHRAHEAGMFWNNNNDNNAGDDGLQLQYDLDLVTDLVTSNNEACVEDGVNRTINASDYLLFDHYENKPDNGHREMYFY
ncbi:unnamed protein product [Cuscuta campestris]|uniref:Transcription factor n=1 Tax=Cuscuta campestris TaxID=132261 RepID=A0A484N5I3_9ASTE|nr:unnamed protein product [Cuscuta campestris]